MGAELQGQGSVLFSFRVSAHDMKLEKLAITSSRMEEDDAPEEPLKDEAR